MSVLHELARIVLSIAECDTVAERVSIIVESIHSYMNVDTCSLYLADDDKQMVLVASHGLRNSTEGRVRIPSGEGLVGLISKSKQPLNIADAPSHGAFYSMAETGEDQYQSFSGVPLVNSGVVVGVLVVQCKVSRLLSEDELAVLVTLGAQLALVVTGNLLNTLYPRSGPTHITGIIGSKGVGIGRAYSCTGVDLGSVTDAPCANVRAEVEQWRTVVATVKNDVLYEQNSLGSELSKEVSAVFDAYQMLLSDPTLITGVEQAIMAGNHLAGALKSVINHYANIFLSMDDAYLRARHEDIIHLGNKLYSSWRGLCDPALDAELSGPLILVGNQVSISDIAAVPRDMLMGILCYQGSSLSHTAVLANALGIPAIMGIGELVGITTGTVCIVDGNVGHCILNPDAPLLREYERVIKEERELRSALAGIHNQPAVTLDGTHIHLFANSGLLADLSPGIASGAEGLGLYRTEIPFMVSQTFPSEEDQVALYSRVFEAYKGKPVYMRILDIGGDKPLPYFPIHEENPALGWRGIRFCLDNSSLLITQIRAMLRSAIGSNNLKILLPMVSSISEIDSFQALLHDAYKQLLAEGYSVDWPKVGVMIEVPAAISQIPMWSKSIDFISIGTNDLSQYLLAVDRNNPRVSSSYDPFHPAVLSEIARAVDYAQRQNLPVSVCGEMASDPAAAFLLVGLGVRTLSMSAAQLPKIKWLIQNVHLKDMQKIANESLTLRDATAIKNLVAQELVTAGLKNIVS
ncbi:MAG: phosphoenolpyruvate-protein phosphotransferase [Halioglobus sp.]